MAESAAEQYRQAMEELTCNNKTQINLLTLLADDSQQYAAEIVKAIEDRIFKVPKEQKLPLIYVVDSIMKNVKNTTYKEQFLRNIVNVFLHVFKEGDEKMRVSLYNLRKTWADLFPKSKLYQLDLKVNAEDRAWPVASPQTGAASSITSAPKVHVNPKFINQSRTGTGAASAQPQNRPPPVSKPAANTTRRVENVPGRPDVKVKREPSSPPLHKPPTVQPKKEILDTLLDLPPIVKSEPFDPVPSPPHNAPKRRMDDFDEATSKKRPSQGEKVFPPNRIVPTAAPGAHAFVVQPKAAAAPLPPVFTAPPFIKRSSPPVPPFNPSFPVPVPGVPLQMPPGFPPITTGTTQPSFPGPSTSAAAFPPPVSVADVPREHVITHETVKLEGVPANNRIFVDGKAHEVMYIGETAVIERNGLPHRIFFAGPPRNVIIDGMVHVLEFGKQKTVHIDGEEHIIKFGAPSRELYMGAFPFKGAFGGPPIFATINGTRHEIRLGGPAPEVKIEPQPAYDLARFMNQLRAPAPAPAAPAPKPEADNIKSLLANLIKKGVLNLGGKTTANRENEPPPPRAKTPESPIVAGKKSMERRGKEPSKLHEFQMDLLKIRYDSVIESLHQKRALCPQCGLRLDNLKGEKYQLHLDWHVKKNLKMLGDASTSRRWYPTAANWVKMTDIEEEEQSKPEEEIPKEVNVAIEDTESRRCASCGDPFNRIFDEEEDNWQMQDCVIVNGKTYHSQCVVDATMMDTEESETREQDGSGETKEEMKPFLSTLDDDVKHVNTNSPLQS